MAWERVVALLALGLGALAWVFSFGLPRTEGPGPELFPRILGTVLILGGIGQLLSRGKATQGKPLKGWLRALLLLLLLLLAPSVVPHLGLATSAALIASLGALLAHEPLSRSLVLAFFTWALVYLVFVHILGVPL